MKKTVSAEHPSVLSDSQRAMLEKLATLSDADIDYTDAPSLPDSIKTRSQQEFRQLYKPVKVQKTLRLDADILQWFEKRGPGHLTRINDALREYITTHTD